MFFYYISARRPLIYQFTSNITLGVVQRKSVQSFRAGQFFGLLGFFGELFGVASFTVLVKAVLIGAGLAAITGGNVWKGALTGAVGGMFSVGFNPVMMMMAGGALGALVTGGDPVMGVMFDMTYQLHPNLWIWQNKRRPNSE
jgi:hypothetical protein